MKINELKKDIKRRLEEAGIADAETDTRLLLKEFAGVSRADLYAEPDMETRDDMRLEELEAAVLKRISRIPLQHILGETSFMGFDFLCSPDALIPRPDTEILVEEVLRDYHEGSRIHDLCTGTGCIIISLMALTGDCMGVGTDISGSALDLAKKNAEKVLGSSYAEKLGFFEGDLYEALPGGEKFEIIVSNPPYIKSADIDGLMPEVKDHDPHLALDGGEDGLIFYRRIIEGAHSYLKGGGELYLEIGAGQAEDVSNIMKENRFLEINVIKDFGGNDRVVTGILSSL